MICPVYKYTKADKLVAAVLAAVMLALCLGSLDYGCTWGDDSAAVLTLVLCAASCCVQYRADAENIRAIRANGEDIHAGSEGMYSPAAIEVYDYIKANTPPDAVFAFHKPRALYLNTGRLAFSYLVNDRDVMDADYCILPELFYESYVNGETPEWFSSFGIVLRNSELTLMKKISAGSEG